MSDVIQNATSAVASLPALIIQRADPGLYNLLTNGVLQARLDFDRSKLTCRAMAIALRTLPAVSSTDAVSAIEEAEESRGNEGVPWVGGSNAGGRNQPPVKIVADVTRDGYNLVNGRDVDVSNSGDHLSSETWSSPQDAVAWATRVLGETEQRTCEDCTKTQTSPEVGLPPLIQEEFDTRFGTLQELIDGTVPMTFDNLRDASSSSILEARCEKVREAGVVMSQAVLIAVGIDWDGRHQVLAGEMANRESRSAWKDFLVSLKARGLKGVELVVSDDHAGLVAAIGEVIP